MLSVDTEQLPVAAARRGDPAAWDALFHRYQLPLYSYAYQLLHDEQACLDAVQETFVRAVRHLDALRDDDRVGGWLFGILRQQCLQHWRRSGRAEAAHQALAAEPAAPWEGPDELLIREEQSTAFYAGLDQLPPPHREVLVLHFLEDFPLDEIARITDTPVGTVKSRLHYAKRTLRERLESL